MQRYVHDHEQDDPDYDLNDTADSNLSDAMEEESCWSPNYCDVTMDDDSLDRTEPDLEYTADMFSDDEEPRNDGDDDNKKEQDELSSLYDNESSEWEEDDDSDTCGCSDFSSDWDEMF